MSKFKHTPGPWIKGKGNTVTKSDGLKIVFNMPSAAAPESNVEDRIAADARLTAAAPDMLEALSELYNAIDNCIDLTPELLQRVARIIKNATE